VAEIPFFQEIQKAGAQPYLMGLSAVLKSMANSQYLQEQDFANGMFNIGNTHSCTHT